MLRPQRFRRLATTLAFAATASLPVFAQQSDTQDKAFDVQSSVGDLHVGKDADARKQGLPLYPGARPKHEADNDPINFGILTEAFGLKLIVAKYESDDSPAKVIDFYRSKLGKFGKVLECHSQKEGNVHVNSSDDSKDDKQLKCDDNNSGSVTELKVGTEDNQHVVAVEAQGGKGSTFSLVYVYARGKQGDI
jgi:hypothetical protein